MSQHIWKGNGVIVTLGYDRPLGYIFCSVESSGEEGALVYSNLDDRKAGITQQDVYYYRHILANLGIDIPEKMYEEVMEDQRNRVGNRQVMYRKDKPS